jgi:DNA-directed RNA polymerase subunit L
MDIKILEDTKNRLVFDALGESHTLLGSLKKELYSDEHVKAAGYHIEHPLLNIPRFIIETDGADPRKTISAAIKRLQKNIEKLQEQSKELK